MKDETNKKYWDKTAKLYTGFMSKNDTAYDLLCDKISESLNKNQKVLELACGTGQLTFRLSEKAKSWIATDYSEAMVDETKKNGSNTSIVFEQADATALQYDDNFFDVVIIANALHIMPDPSKALKEIRRVLKKDGILVAPTFVFGKGYKKVKLWAMKLTGFKIFHEWTNESFSNFVSEHGYEIISADTYSGNPLYECLLVAKNS